MKDQRSITKDAAIEDNRKSDVHKLIARGALLTTFEKIEGTIVRCSQLRAPYNSCAKIESTIVNVIESSIARESDFILPIKAGPEIGVASTKVFTAQLAVLACLTIYFSNRRGLLSKNENSLQNTIESLQKNQYDL